MGHVFAVFWILTSTICIAQFFLYIAELNTKWRQHLLVKWVLNRRMKYTDLEAADLDDDGVETWDDNFFGVAKMAREKQYECFTFFGGVVRGLEEQ